VYFQRNGSWQGTLTLKPSGASGANIVVGAYGAGARPKFWGGGGSCINIEGSRITLDNVETRRCGFSGVRVSGKNVIVKYVTSTENAAGVFITDTADNGLYERNAMIDNTVMVTPQGADNDSGAFGFLVHGNNNELRQNVIRGSDAWSPDYGRDGCAIEIYGASNTRVHHNRAENNNCFVELGKLPTDPTSDNNSFDYNVITSVERGVETPRAGSESSAIITRGAGTEENPDRFGPITNTKFRNNSVRLIGNGSSSSAGRHVEAVSCFHGCTAGVLELRANAISVSGTWSRTGYVDSSFANSNYNVFHPALPVQLVRGTFDVAANPRFVSDTDLHLADRSSPAVDRGCTVYWTHDFDGRSAPVNIAGVENGPACAADPDTGAYELQQ